MGKQTRNKQVWKTIIGIYWVQKHDCCSKELNG